MNRAELLARWGTLAPRERLLASGAAVLFAVLLIWLLVWRPLMQAREDLERQVAARRDTLVFMRDAVARLGDRPLAGGADNLPARAEAQARAAGFGASLTRLAQEDGGQVRVRLEGARFDALVTWLAGLERDGGVQVVSLALVRGAEPGLVDADLLLGP